MDTVYAGRWLQVGLESGQIVEKTLAADQVSKWLLGDGLAALWLWEGLDPGRDPLDPASPLLVLNGVLTGSFGPGAARTSWCGRSPATESGGRPTWGAGGGPSCGSPALMGW